MNKVLLGTVVTVALLGQIASADVITAATNNGDINTGSTWTGGVAPVSGDANQWDTGALTVRSGTQTWEGQELRVLTGGRLASGAAGPTLTMNGDLTLDGGTITVLNNNPFTIDLQGNTFNLNSGKLDSGANNASRDLFFANAVLAGIGTITIEGGESAAALRTDVRFQNSVDTSGFTGLFTSSVRARFFLPEVMVANASFAIDIGGSSGISLANSLAVTAATFDGQVIAAGTYTRDELLTLGVSPNRVFSADSAGHTLTVIPEPATLGMFAAAGLSLLFFRRRKFLA